MFYFIINSEIMKLTDTIKSRNEDISYRKLIARSILDSQMDYEEPVLKSLLPAET